MFQLIIAFALITGANIIHHRIPKPVVEVSRQKAAFNFNNKIVYFNFGLKRFISSLFWVETAPETLSLFPQKLLK